MSIKSKLKSHTFILKIYDRILPYYCILFTKKAVEMLYRQTFHKELDLTNPKNLNEKINWLKVYKYKNDPLVIKCADKYRVREYIEEKGYKHILNEIYGVYTNADEIVWEELPNEFALKFNKAAGMNIICNNKSDLDENATLKKVKSWFKSETGERFCELHYRRAKSVVICEKYLKPEKGLLPVDYKVHCINGEPIVTMVCVDREEKTKFVFVDNDYNRVFIDTKNYPDDIIPPKQECFEEIIKISKELSKPFPLVRIDFYIINNKPILGEMTFTPQGGYLNVINQEGLEWLGNKLILKEAD